MRTGVTILLASLSLPAQEPWPVPEPRWQTLDLEARWVAYKVQTDDKPQAKEAWLRFLAAQNEHALLEWIVLYDTTDSPGTVTALSLLQAADAPQWIRCAVWRSNHPDSHSAQAAQNLVQRSPAVATWLRKYDAVRRGMGRHLYAMLEPLGLRDVDVSHYLPPLDPAQVLLADLTAPKQLPELGDAPQADPHVRYLHQVLRAIDAMRTTSLPEPFWIGKLTTLIEHPHPDVRRHAFQALPSFAPERLPLTRLLAVVHDEAATTADRQWALLAYSFGDVPAVFLTLHHVLEDAAHPAWNVTVSRLSEIGALFTAERLAKIAKDTTPEAAAAARAAHSRMLERLRHLQPDSVAPVTRQLFERAAWAAVTGDPLAAALRQGVERQARERVLASAMVWGRDPRVFHHLGTLSETYEPGAWAASHADAVRAWVREQARTLHARRDDR